MTADTGRRAGDAEGTCAECRRPILWAWTAKGRRMPLDLEVRPEGDPAATVATYRDHLSRLRVRTLDTDNPRPAAFERLGVPHLATCPPRVAAREAAASLRAAKAGAPNFRDVEELREALHAAEHHEPAVDADQADELERRRRRRP